MCMYYVVLYYTRVVWVCTFNILKLFGNRVHVEVVYM